MSELLLVFAVMAALYLIVIPAVIVLIFDGIEIVLTGNEEKEEE